MANLNRVFLIGRLTADPELRYTPGGGAVTDLRLATTRGWTKDGERREETLFIDVTVWGKTAEHCCQYLAKGRECHVSGHLTMDTWDDKATGEKRSRVKVTADEVQFLGGPPSGGPREDRGEPAPANSAPRLPVGRPAPRPRMSQAEADAIEDDEDIPF